MYTTKAAGGDKKLYKTIENSLESQYESVLRLSASLSPPTATSAAESLNLSRSSPFGPLSENSSRKTFAYLIATLNASHPDYDFSYLLRPSDFRREKSLKKVMTTIDTTLFNLRPNLARDVTPPSPVLGSSSSTRATGVLIHSWGPRMWKIIDDQMSLKDCAIYAYAPEDDPYDGEDGAIWSLNYFFFNKGRKRVCYLYLRGISILSGTPATPDPEAAPLGHPSPSLDDFGPVTPIRDRPRYWIRGRSAHTAINISDEEDDTRMTVDDDEGFDEPGSLSPTVQKLSTGRPGSRPDVPEFGHYLSNGAPARDGGKPPIYGVSEENADMMEV